MQKAGLVRDMLASFGLRVTKQDASAEIMRLAQDPLLLHEHLQFRESMKPVAMPPPPDGGLDSHLQRLSAMGFDIQPAGRGEPPETRYAPMEGLTGTSLHPEAFNASGEDRAAAIEHTASSLPEEFASTPPNLLGSIIVALGALLAVACVFDALTR